MLERPPPFAGEVPFAGEAPFAGEGPPAVEKRPAGVGDGLRLIYVEVFKRRQNDRSDLLQHRRLENLGGDDLSVQV